MRARLSDSSASSGSEPERRCGGGGERVEGRGARGLPSRRASAGEESAMGPAEAARSGRGPRGRCLRRCRRRRPCFLLTEAADRGAAGAAGWRRRREAAGLAWRAPPPPRPPFPFPGRTCRAEGETSPRSARPMAAPHPERRDREALRCEETGRRAAYP